MERFACSNADVWTDFNFSFTALFLNLLLLTFFLFAGLRKLALQATPSTEEGKASVSHFPNSIATILILACSVCTWFVFGTQISCSDSKRIVTYSFGFASRNEYVWSNVRSIEAHCGRLRSGLNWAQLYLLLPKASRPIRLKMEYDVPERFDAQADLIRNVVFNKHPPFSLDQSVRKENCPPRAYKLFEDLAEHDDGVSPDRFHM
jgi:hypothetical protein